MPVKAVWAGDAEPVSVVVTFTVQNRARLDRSGCLRRLVGGLALVLEGRTAALGTSRFTTHPGGRRL